MPRASRVDRVREAWGLKKAVVVEGLEAPGTDPNVLFASNEVDKNFIEHQFAETELVKINPQHRTNYSLVHKDDPYEIRVAGMSVKAFDCSLSKLASDNELLMYSIQTDPEAGADDSEGIPFIHYDPKSDGRGGGTKPDIFVQCPASKNLALVSDGKPLPGSTELRSAVNCRFKILELDRVTPVMRQSIAGIEELGSQLNRFSMVAPYLGVLSPALSIASNVGRQALKSYERPDHVISIDMNFLLADKEEVSSGQAQSGDYLRVRLLILILFRSSRSICMHSQNSNTVLLCMCPYHSKSLITCFVLSQYGYYFFLSEPVGAKLYAATRVSTNIRLMMRRDDGREPKYFPLTGVSYLVIHVSRRTSSTKLQRKPLQLAHSSQLEQIFKESQVEGNAHNVQKLVKDLGQRLGVIDGTTNKRWVV